MIPRGTGHLVGGAVAAWLAALVYGYGTGGNRLGPLTIGLWGAVGDRVGYVVLLGCCGSLLVLVGLALVDRSSIDPDPAAVVDPAFDRSGVRSAPTELGTERPAELAVEGVGELSVWPFCAAVAFSLALVGLVIDWMFVVVAALGLVVVAVASVTPRTRAPEDRADEATSILVEQPWVRRGANAVTALGLAASVLLLGRGLVSDGPAATDAVAGMAAVFATVLGRAAFESRSIDRRA